MSSPMNLTGYPTMMGSVPAQGMAGGINPAMAGLGMGGGMNPGFAAQMSSPLAMVPGAALTQPHNAPLVNLMIQFASSAGASEMTLSAASSMPEMQDKLRRDSAFKRSAVTDIQQELNRRSVMEGIISRDRNNPKIQRVFGLEQQRSQVFNQRMALMEQFSQLNTALIRQSPGSPETAAIQQQIQQIGVMSNLLASQHQVLASQINRELPRPQA